MAEKQVGGDQIAALIIEPIQGEGGFVVPAPGFLPALQKWCNDNGIVLIADEVQTGFTRTGAWFACDHEGVVPDLVTIAKGIAGGLPLSAVTGRAELMDAVHPGGLGGTYGGNPVACAAALGAIATMREEDLIGAAQRIERLAKDRLQVIADKVPAIGDIRGRGGMLAIEFVKPGTTEPDAELTAARGQGVPRAGRAHPDLRHLRQRHPAAAAAGHQRRAAAGGPAGARGRAAVHHRLSARRSAPRGPPVPSGTGGPRAVRSRSGRDDGDVAAAEAADAVGEARRVPDDDHGPVAGDEAVVRRGEPVGVDRRQVEQVGGGELGGEPLERHRRGLVGDRVGRGVAPRRGLVDEVHPGPGLLGR